MLLFIFQTINIYSEQFALVLMGLLLVATVLFAPNGFIIEFCEWCRRLRRMRRRHADLVEGAAARRAGGPG